MPLNSWVNVDGVKCVDVSNMSGAQFCDADASNTNYPPLWGLGVDDRETIYNSGLEVFYHVYYTEAKGSANHTMEISLGEHGGANATERSVLSTVGIGESVSFTVLAINSLNDLEYKQSWTVGTKSVQSVGIKIVPCYVKLGAPYMRESWGYALVIKQVSNDGDAGYYVYNYLPGAKIGTYTWSGFSLNNSPDISEGKRNDTPEGGDRGGDGGQTNPRVNIETPELPNIDMNASGIYLYGLSSNEMRLFTKYLWTSDWGDVIKKIRNDPMQNIISLGVIDLNLNRSETTIVVGNVETGCDAGIVNSFIEIDCGSIKLNEYYATFADYEPNVSLSLYLPKLGFVGIPAGVLVNNVLRVVYHIELSSGNGVIYLLLTNTRNDVTYIYKTYSCQCVSFLPLTASDHTQQMLTYVNSIANLTRSTMSGNPVSITNSMMSGAISNLTSREQTEVDGTLSGMSSLMSYKVPYLIINANYVVKPSNYGDENGYCLYTTKKISDMSGYVQTLNYSPAFSAPSDILAAIAAKMNEGVYISE